MFISLEHEALVKLDSDLLDHFDWHFDLICFLVSSF